MVTWDVECSAEVYESDGDVVGVFYFDGCVLGVELVVFVGSEQEEECGEVGEDEDGDGEEKGRGISEVG